MLTDVAGAGVGVAMSVASGSMVVPLGRSQSMKKMSTEHCCTSTYTTWSSLQTKATPISILSASSCVPRGRTKNSVV